ncbi:MAG: hypothetical protein K1X75_02050 [Leptospirales bacterium]|nr:hypothetical protein [Leptospirales bacterium]
MLAFLPARRQTLRRLLTALLALWASALIASDSDPLPDLSRHDVLPEDTGLHADHYPASNERRIDLFRAHIANLGGGYVGVGTDQNFTFIAWARSEYAWLMDFDYVAVDVNRIHMFFITISPRYADFRSLWEKRNRAQSLRLLEARFGGEPDYPRIRAAFQVAHRGSTDVPERIRDLDYMVRKFSLSTFVNNQDDYNYIRDMIRAGRIRAVPGDLKGDVTMQEIARISEDQDAPVRLIYTSNAEEYFRYPDAMRRNFLALPHDERGFVIRTATSGAKYVLGYPEGEKFPDDFPFHYNLQTIPSFRAWMSQSQGFRLLDMLRTATRVSRGLSLLDKTPAELGFSPAAGAAPGARPGGARQQ